MVIVSGVGLSVCGGLASLTQQRLSWRDSGKKPWIWLGTEIKTPFLSSHRLRVMGTTSLR